jgi:probable rRNA maturation factor
MEFVLLKSARVPSGAISARDLENLAGFVLKAEKVKNPESITLELTGHKRIHELNRRFRGVDRTTDVISFRQDSFDLLPASGREKARMRASVPSPLPSPVSRRARGLVGDIAINVQQAAIQAKKMQHSLKREIRLLWIHAILHLLDYTDYDPIPRRIMFKRQNALLLRWERSS